MRTFVHALLCGLAFLAGCAGDHRKDARPGGKEGPRLVVPFFPDRRDQWGPAALAGVLNYWGRPAEPAALRREIYFPKQRGSVALDLKNAALARGLQAEMSTGSLEVLKRELDAGRPVIVLVNIGYRFLPVRNFMVVTGYNEWLGGVYAHFGPNKDAFLPYRMFEKDWEKTGRWLLLVAETRSPPIKEEKKTETSAPPRIEKRPAPRIERCLPVVPASASGDARCPTL